jgi:hypothetical protein
MIPRLLLLALLLAALGCGDDDDNKPNIKPGNNDMGDMDPDMVVAGAQLTIADQTLTDTAQVSASRVVADSASFVAIYATDASGKAAALLGHAPVAAGTTNDVTISLSRSVTHQEKLIAQLHVDSPADGQFMPSADGSSDPIALDADSRSIRRTFVASFNPLVRVQAQSPAPLNVVTVEQVTSRGAGFLAIHEQRANGQIGAPIGHVAVVNGSANTNLSITLNRDLSDGETLYAALHVDDPADGQFTFGTGNEDPIALDDAMVSVAPSFTITVTTITPSITVTDQTVNPIDEVTISRAVSDGPGWVVVHANDGQGLPGEILGQTALVGGEHNNVKVRLSRDVVSGETLIAALHKDAGTIGTFEFPGADVAVSDAQGTPVRFGFIVLIAQGEPAIEVQDQEADPINTVTIKRVTARTPGFLVIYEADPNGVNALGSIIGATPVNAGVNSRVAVLLSRAARHDETLTAALHLDLGDAGVFEYPGPDDLVVDMMSQPVARTFRTYVTNTQTPSVSVLAQDPNPLNRVVIEQVVYGANGWIVIHEDNAGQPGAVLGRTRLMPGVTRNVAVTLSRDAVDGETLYAMLHKDEGMIGTYEFPGPDGPVLDAMGAIIAPAFTINVRANLVFTIDQSPRDVSTILTVDSVYARQAGFVALYSGAELLGHVAVPQGLSNQVEVVLNRPATDAEQITARLHLDSPADGQFTHPINAAQDAPALDGAGLIVESSFFTLIGNDVPAVRFTVNAVGTTAYRWVSAHPARFQSDISSIMADNPTITLRRGWRYAILNSASSTHPLELIHRGQTRAQDVVLLSQSVEGSAELEPEVLWDELTPDTIQFTVDGSVASNGATGIDGYRCAVAGHTAMRGTIVLAD